MFWNGIEKRRCGANRTFPFPAISIYY
jgi:hypothetical protein